MSQLLSFLIDVPCPNNCNESGGFVKVMTIKRVLNKKSKNDTNDKFFAGEDNHKLATLITCNEEVNYASPNEKFKIQDQSQRNRNINTKIDWSQIAAQSQTRPCVSKYSINRYSLDDWRRHNEKVLGCSDISECNILNYIVQTAIGTGFGNMDKAQREGNNLLKQKAKCLYRCKVEVEQLCKEIAKEVELLEQERQRVKSACRALMLPEAITKECIELRSNKAETELVADLSDQELKKEMELVNEVRATLRSTLHRIDEQLAIDKAAKHKIEYDWCEKTVDYNTDAISLNLNIHSNTLMFKPGAVKFVEHTAPQSYWEFYCRGNIEDVEAVRQASQDLRSTFDAMLINNGTELRAQADRTDKALAETVTLTSALVTKLEERLRCTLQKVAEIELLIKTLQESIVKSHRDMKLAQTRLNNRNIGRPHGENVRDQPHFGLIHEVKVIHGTVTSFLVQLKNAEKARQNLMAKRVEFEKDIAAKRKSLNIDRERCGMIRSHYPGASELSGL